MFNNFDYLNGNISYIIDDFNYPQEDMLMVLYPNEHILDVGWYGDKNGFIINLIRENEWRKPIAKYIAKSKEELFILLPKAIQHINQVSQSCRPHYGGLWDTVIFTV